MGSYFIITVRILSLLFASGLTFVSIKLIYCRKKNGKEIFFDILALLTGVSAVLYYGYIIVSYGMAPVEDAILMVMRMNTLLALFTLFGLLYRRMLVE
jgi:hypothetical protein